VVVKKLLLKVVGVIVLLSVLVGLALVVWLIGKNLLGLAEDPRLRIAELAAQAARSEAERAYIEYMEVRAEADRLRQAVGLTEEEGENLIRRSVAQGYTSHTRSHALLVMGLVGVTGFALVGILFMGIVAWRSDQA